MAKANLFLKFIPQYSNFLAMAGFRLQQQDAFLQTLQQLSRGPM